MIATGGIHQKGKQTRKRKCRMEDSALSYNVFSGLLEYVQFGCGVAHVDGLVAAVEAAEQVREATKASEGPIGPIP